VNVDPKESDLTRFDPKELVAAVTAPPVAGTPDAGMAATSSDVERTQSFWWYLLGVALVLMAAETVLSNRLSKAGGGLSDG
jgi:hypothetical protein